LDRRTVNAVSVASGRGYSFPDLGKSDELAKIVVQRIDDHARPELATVLAHPPAFVLELTFVKGSLQGKRLTTTGNLFSFREKNVEVLTDDLACCVSIEVLRPGIPGSDEASWIKHQDGVVPHARHEELERVPPGTVFERGMEFAMVL
jgi:hypothetical protein